MSAKFAASRSRTYSGLLSHLIKNARPRMDTFTDSGTDTIAAYSVLVPIDLHCTSLTCHSPVEDVEMDHGLLETHVEDSIWAFTEQRQVLRKSIDPNHIR